MSNFHIIDSFQNDDNFLAVMLVMGALFFAVAVIVGIVLCLIFITLIISLFAAGLVSTSVLVGFQQKSTSSGFKTFFVGASILASSVASIIFFLIANTFWHWSGIELVIFAGLMTGVLSGWILGVLMFKAFKKIINYLKRKYDSSKEKLIS